MIDHLDTMLFRLFRWQVNELTGNGQVRFQPPDQDWRAMVPGITDGGGVVANSLNVYLADLRENRKLRTNQRDRTVVADNVYETPPPRRVDCHYLISAWSPVAPGPAIDPTPDEHALLADVARVIGQHDVLDPVTIFGASRPPGLLPAPVPPPLIDEQLPVTLLPVEGFPKIAEFWGTMGDRNRWKPFVYAVITIPLKDSPVRAGPLVTTAFVETMIRDLPGTGETFMHIGGTLRTTAVPNAPVVAGATVELMPVAGVRRQLVITDVDGRFVFVQVAPGKYRIRYSATGFGSLTTPAIAVPAPGGSYDVHF